MKLAEMTMKQLKTRKRISVTVAVMLSILPAATVILSRWKLYTAEPTAAISLGAGGIMVGAVIVLEILGRLRISGDIWVLGFLVVLLFLLRTILDDLLLLTFVLFCGRVLSRVLTATYVNRVRGEIEARDAAERAGKTVMDGVKNYLEGMKHE